MACHFMEKVFHVVKDGWRQWAAKFKFSYSIVYLGLRTLLCFQKSREFSNSAFHLTMQDMQRTDIFTSEGSIYHCMFWGSSGRAAPRESLQNHGVQALGLKLTHGQALF